MKVSYSISLGFHVYFIVDELKNSHLIGLPMKTVFHRLRGKFHAIFMEKNVQ